MGLFAGQKEKCRCREQNRLGERDDRRDQKRASPSLGLSGVAGNAETTFSDWDKPGSIPRPGSPSRPAVWEQCARYRLRASIQFSRMRRHKGDLARPEPRTGRPRMPGREPCQVLNLHPTLSQRSMRGQVSLPGAHGEKPPSVWPE